MNNTNHPSIANIMSVWRKASVQYFMRQIEMLYDAKILNFNMITGPSEEKSWNNIPIILLQNNTLFIVHGIISKEQYHLNHIA